MPRQRQFGREALPNLPEIQSQKWVEATLNAGMMTNIDPADIPPSALQLAKNARVRGDKTSRRPGSILLTPAAPDANPVLKYAFLKKEDGTGYTVRFTPSGLHYINMGAWAPLAGALAGSEADRFNTAVVLNELVFTNNGVDPIQKVDFGALSFGNLGNAPAYRYLCGFFNRVVGANLRNNNEVQIGWSGDANIDEWDPLIDESAGSGPLIDSPADLSDFITGLHAWTNSMVVLREKSVWIATKQPIPQNPFNFHAVIPGTGCDSPYSAIKGGEALIWFDKRTRAVYAYMPGGGFEMLSGNVENEIARNVDDVELVFAGYDPREHEYTVYVPMVASSYVAGWTYNRRYKTWTYNEYYDLTGVDDVELGSGGIIADDLGGLADDLEGQADDLSPSQITIANHTYGRGDGTGAVLEPTTSFDAPHTDFPVGIPYTTELVSKVFTIPENDIYIAEIRIDIKATVGGSFRIEFSRTGGEGLDPWILAKVVDPNILNVSRLIKYKKLIRCRKFAWRLVAEQGLFDVLSYEVHVYQAGKSVQ